MIQAFNKPRAFISSTSLFLFCYGNVQYADTPTIQYWSFPTKLLKAVCLMHCIRLSTSCSFCDHLFIQMVHIKTSTQRHKAIELQKRNIVLMNLLQSKLLYHIRHENDHTSIFHSKTEEMFGMKHIWSNIRKGQWHALSILHGFKLYRSTLIKISLYGHFKHLHKALSFCTR